MVKNLPANAEDMGLIPGLGGSPGEGNGYPVQYSCLGNPMDRGAWRAIVHGVAEESELNMILQLKQKQHHRSIYLYVYNLYSYIYAE